MDNIEDTNYKFNSQDIENIWYIFFCLADSTFSSVDVSYGKKGPYMLSGETMMSICKTLETIDFCCNRDAYSDAYTLLRKYRDDLMQYLFVLNVIQNKHGLTDEEVTAMIKASFDNAKDALSSLEQKQPDLIISDVMMPGIDGLSFAQKIKQHKLWSHIPLILLSALHHEDDQVKGIESGAEAYVTKPFNVKYLEKIVYRLIKREADLKEYYSSIFSSFTMEHGNCIHKEDQEFLDKMLEIIEKNIANPDLQVELLSSEMGYSTRQFYRKLKPITEQSPADIIKEYRLTMAERLLIAKNLTIEEIMDQTGFNNRGTFYKLFSKRYGMPPRQYREQQKENVKKEKISGISDE